MTTAIKVLSWIVVVVSVISIFSVLAEPTGEGATYSLIGVILYTPLAILCLIHFRK